MTILSKLKAAGQHLTGGVEVVRDPPPRHPGHSRQEADGEERAAKKV
jgi:hypothetical protein